MCVAQLGEISERWRRLQQRSPGGFDAREGVVELLQGVGVSASHGRVSSSGGATLVRLTGSPMVPQKAWNLLRRRGTAGRERTEKGSGRAVGPQSEPNNSIASITVLPDCHGGLDGGWLAWNIIGLSQSRTR
jgi:hypothetical protein